MQRIRLSLFILLFLWTCSLQAQGLLQNRSSLYVYTGSSGANLSQFNDLLKERGHSPLENRYRSYGLGYQARVNDFILGVELSQHQGRPADLEGYRINYRASRALVNFGLAGPQ